MNDIIAFSYFGSKYNRIDEMIPHMPEHQHYLEVFGGSAAFLLNKPKSNIETYNDLDNDVVTFFRVLRDREDELIRAIDLTPYSRFEHDLCEFPPDDMDELERARRFYVVIRQSRSSIKNGSWSYQIRAEEGRKAQTVEKWKNAPNTLRAVAKRLKNVQIECLPALDILQRYDDPGVWALVDPPYPRSVRNETVGSYEYEMPNDDQHLELLTVLRGMKAKVMLCGYRCALYDEMLADWNRVELREKAMGSSDVRKTNREVLWMNYVAHPRLEGF